MVSTSRPLFMNFRAILEDMHVESLDDSKIKFTYSAYVEPSFLVGMIGFTIYPTLSNMFKNATDNFKTNVEDEIENQLFSINDNTHSRKIHPV